MIRLLLTSISPRHPIEAYRVLASNRSLIIEMARRELMELHSGQAFGAAWAFLHPLVFICVYIFLFTIVFKMRIGDSNTANYPIYLLSGLIPWLMSQEALSKSSMVLIANSSLVKKVSFPLEVLPAKTVISCFVTEMILFTALIVYVTMSRHSLPWTCVLVPFLVFLQVTMMIGIAMFLSVLAVYLRDISEFVRVFSLVNIYLIPVVYLPDWVPPAFRPVLYMNPFSYPTWCFQDALYFGEIRHPWAWIVFPCIAFFTLSCGFRVFRKLKPFLGSVL